jgi:hypothetical protein
MAPSEPSVLFFITLLFYETQLDLRNTPRYSEYSKKTELHQWNTQEVTRAEAEMKIDVDVEEGNAVVQSLVCEADPQETIEQFASKLASQIGMDTEDVLESLGTNGTSFQRHERVGECIHHGNRWRHRRVCLDVRFESENEVHYFSPRAPWRRVHHWGCTQFKVAHDACANLELHDGSSEGPVLNEKVQIGSFAGCKTVWLVKPGPEPNGHNR